MFYIDIYHSNDRNDDAEYECGVIMELIKEIIKAFCVIGIILSITEFLLPNSDYKKCVRFVIGLIFIISVINPFFSDGMKLNLNLLTTPDLNKLEKLESEVNNALLEDFESSLEENIKKMLKNKNLDVSSVDIKASSDEYNNTVIKKITITGAENKEEIESKIKDFLETEDIEIEIKEN